MGLFNKKRSVRALGDSAIEAIKNDLNNVLSVAKTYDTVMSKDGSLMISLEGRIRGDMVAFVLYLSGITKGVDLREIAVINQIFDIDLSHVDFTIFSKDVGTKSFENAVPPSILILKEFGNVLQREQLRKSDGTTTEIASRTGVSDLAGMFVNDLINLYAEIGSAFLSADLTITERESTDLIRYLYMMTRSIFGPDATLPEGAAQRTVMAHKRLFGKVPKV